jgi:hypothetical protein
MAADVIGRCRCPVCSSDRASLRLSCKGLPYILCNTCHIQLFSRSDMSDSLLRALLITEQAATAPAPEPAPTPAAKPAAAPVPAPEPEAKPKQPEPEKPVRTGLGWGVMA